MVRCVVGSVLLLASLGAQEPLEPGPVSYHRAVRPLLMARCAGCHQPARAKGDLVLTRVATLLAGDDPAVVAGHPDDSPLIDAVSECDGEPPAMPEDGEPLARAEIELLRQWIAEGAHDDSPKAARVDAEHPPRYLQPPVITSLAFSPAVGSDAALLAVAGNHEVLLHDLSADDLSGNDNAPVARLIGLSERIESIAFSPDGKSLAVVGGLPGQLGEVQVWDVERHRLRLSRTFTYDSLFGVSWSPDGELIAFGATDTAVRAVRARTGEQVLFHGAHTDWVLGTVFSTDGSHLVTVGRDRSMKLYLVATEQFIDNITSITPGALKGGLMAVDRHPSKDELLACGADGVPKIYRMYREKKRKIGDDYNLIRAFDALPGRIFAGVYDRNGKRVAIGSSTVDGGEVRVYAATDGVQAEDREQWRRELDTAVYTVAFRADGSQVAAGGFDGRVYVLDAGDGAIVREFVPVPLATDAIGPTEAALRVGSEGQR